ncbi:MAG: hypothetical protein O6768_01255, partial [Planctomycetota bacterium]|nr:hypothetical protein [Planctomycetota bacterium]
RARGVASRCRTADSLPTCMGVTPGRIAQASCYSAAMRARFVAQLIAALIVGGVVALDYLDGGFHPLAQRHPVIMSVVLGSCVCVVGLAIEAAYAAHRRRP